MLLSLLFFIKVTNKTEVIASPAKQCFCLVIEVIIAEGKTKINKKLNIIDTYTCHK